MADIHYMTADGLEKLKKELADALAQRPVISAAIAEAREKGDLSENAEYDAAREAQGLLEVKIANLKNQVANAKVIDESQIGTDKVSMMNKVKVENLTMKRVMEFVIVGETEADFSKGRLAVTNAWKAPGTCASTEIFTLPVVNTSPSVWPIVEKCPWLP